MDTSPDGLYKELAEYTKRDVELVKLRCQGAGAELAWRWAGEEDLPQYYQETALYLFDLTQYQTMLRQNNIPIWLSRKIQEYGWKTVLDFGGGIGEWSILFAQEGCNVTYQDVEPSYTKAYAEYRFYKHGVKVEVVPHTVAVTGHFDAIIAMDVLEHLEKEQAERLIEQWNLQTNYLFANPDQIKYNFLYPQHITYYNLDPYWERVEGYLYKARPVKTPEDLFAMSIPVLEGAEA